MSVFSKISKNSGAVLPASARNQCRKRLGLMLCKGKKDGNSNGCMNEFLPSKNVSLHKVWWLHEKNKFEAENYVFYNVGTCMDKRRYTWK